ncbi:MAG TPA: hypothetical protein VJN93_02165 [Candidatus Acidoferrum sp.]|nr:hypothetical protein [Candidatus Acidoferrum sp.]
MVTNLIWLSGAAFEAILLFRSWKASLLRRYPFFYAYIAWVLLAQMLGFWFYLQKPNLYQAWYWDTQFIAVSASYGICFEIFKSALRHNQGVARAARKLLLVVFVVALSYAGSDFMHGGFRSVARAAADLGSYLSYVEAVLLLLMLWLFGRYRIPFGRNLLGLTLGYALWVGTDVIILVLLFLPGNGASIELRQLAPIVFLITLVVWCVALWSFQAEPLQPLVGAIDRDYALLAAKTRTSLAHLSVLVGRTLRP